MKKKLLLTSVLLLSVLTFGQKWEYLGENYLGDKTYVQNKAINPSSYGIPKVWSKQIVGIFTTQKNGKKIPVKNAIVKTLHSYDCNERRIRLVQILIYDAKEQLVTSNKYDDNSSESEWFYVAPESTGEFTLDFVCSKL